MALVVFAVCSCKLDGVIKQVSCSLRQGRQLQIHSRRIKLDAQILGSLTVVIVKGDSNHPTQSCGGCIPSVFFVMWPLAQVLVV